MSDDDEAQTDTAPAPETPAPVSSGEPEAFEFSLELRIDATVAVNSQDWLKPGVTVKKKWRVRDGILPSRKELELTVGYMQHGALNPMLSEMIDLMMKGVAEAQNNR